MKKLYAIQHVIKSPFICTELYSLFIYFESFEASGFLKQRKLLVNLCAHTSYEANKIQKFCVAVALKSDKMSKVISDFSSGSTEFAI